MRPDATYEAPRRSLSPSAIKGDPMMMTATTDTLDLTHVETLLYVYPNPHGGKIEIEVEDPETIRVTPEGDHEIVDLADVGVIMPAGWLQITVYPRVDCKPFKEFSANAVNS
jgi:hypothetical protein